MVQRGRRNYGGKFGGEPFDIPVDDGKADCVPVDNAEILDAMKESADRFYGDVESLLDGRRP